MPLDVCKYASRGKERRFCILLRQPLFFISLTANGDPLHIYVKTRLTAGGSEIVVENNGAEFDPAADNNDPHIALDNIRQRLELMCGGTLTISPREGGGTAVRVTILNSDK